MDIDKEGRNVWIPDRNLEVMADFGSDKEKELEAIMITRAEESDKKRAQLYDFNDLLRLKRDDEYSILSKLRDLTVCGV